jgi:hypothetical protein
MDVADVLWKTGLEVLRRNPTKDSQRRRFVQMCSSFTQGPLNAAVLKQHVVDTVVLCTDPDSALAELRRFTVGSCISMSPVLHYAIACCALAVAAIAADESEGLENFRVTAARETAVDAAMRLLEVAPAAAQSYVTMWQVLNSCGRPVEAAALVEAALDASSELRLHPSLLHIAVSDPAISAAVALSSAICLLQLDPCHPAPAACVLSALADGRVQLPAAAEALAASLDTSTPLHAGTWKATSTTLARFMWSWGEGEKREWLGWRFLWWPRLHLQNFKRQLSIAASHDDRLILACKALLAMLLQGPPSTFYDEFVRECSGWEEAIWLQETQLRCREMQILATSTGE